MLLPGLERSAGLPPLPAPASKSNSCCLALVYFSLGSTSGLNCPLSKCSPSPTVFCIPATRWRWEGVGWQVLAMQGRPPAARDHRDTGRIQEVSAPTSGSLKWVFFGLDLGPKLTEEAASSPLAFGSSAEAQCCPHRHARQEACSMGHGHKPLRGVCAQASICSPPENRFSGDSQPFGSSHPFLQLITGVALRLHSPMALGPNKDVVLARSPSSLSTPLWRGG